MVNVAGHALVLQLCLDPRFARFALFQEVVHLVFQVGLKVGVVRSYFEQTHVSLQTAKVTSLRLRVKQLIEALVCDTDSFGGCIEHCRDILSFFVIVLKACLQGRHLHVWGLHN